MAKKCMKRSERTHTQPRNQQEPIPEIQGKAKHTKEKAGPSINGIGASGQTAFHRGRPILADAYPAIDSDLARNDLENGIPADDLPEL